MADNEKLNDMLDNLIGKNQDQAQVDFHEYLQSKVQDVVSGQSTNNAENKDNEE